MPKIPTFTTTARPTADVSSVTSNIQASLSSSPMLQILEPTEDIVKFYLKEKELGYKNEAGKLEDAATVEIFNAKKESELKSSPEEGLNDFNNKLNGIISKYQSKASNKYVEQYFINSISKEKEKYISSILNKTRDNLVATRVGQTDTKIKRKIFDTVHSQNKFSFSILSDDVLKDYEQLEKDGLISKEAVIKFKEELPMMIEKEIINKIAINNAAKALVSLDDPNNYLTLKGEDREKIKSELRTKARFQSEVLKNSVNINVLDVKKKISKAWQGNQNQYFGIDPSELSKYSTGNKDYDEQLKQLNIKLINSTITADTDYKINDLIIKKILNGTIQNPFDKFSLPNDKQPLSITQRIGNGINLKDDNFFNKLFDVQKNTELNNANKQFFNFIDKIVPMIEGTPGAKVFDQNYNNRLSNFRQDMYANFYLGLKNKISVSELLNPNSNQYIAKKILDYAPPKSDLRKALLDFAKTKENQVPTIKVDRLPGESYSSWRNRWQQSQKK